MPLRVRVCRLADVVPGELRAFDVSGVTWPVIVTYAEGQMIAFPGVCPHDDVSLRDYGELDEDNHVVCRVHGYRFDVMTGKCEHVPSLHLRRYKITVTGDEIWVDLL